jgi:hypothetical protein
MPEHLWGMAVSASQTDEGVAALVSRPAGEEAAFARIVAAYITTT